jgi:hypothetical protein
VNSWGDLTILLCINKAVLLPENANVCLHWQEAAYITVLAGSDTFHGSESMMVGFVVCRESKCLQVPTARNESARDD